MDLSLVMAELKPGENVSPDLSSYSAMVASWRGTGSPPSLADVNAKWTQIEPKFIEDTTKQETDKELDEAGADTVAMVEALWEKIMDADSTKADALKIIVDQIK